MKRCNKTGLILVLLAMLSVVAAGCGSTENMAYITDAERNAAKEILQNYSAIVMPGDELEVDIVSASPESLYQFYERANAGGNSNRGINDKIRLLRETYLVDSAGNVVLPLLGKHRAAGLTLDELSAEIASRLRDSNMIVDPTIAVRRTNFRVTVIGEVKKPGQMNIKGNRLTILEALAIAGDVTLYGRRDNVKIMRQVQGEQIVSELDLTKKSFLDSPYYYLQQNDIIYVEPTDNMKKRAHIDPNIPSYVTIGVSILRLSGDFFYHVNRTSNLK